MRGCLTRQGKWGYTGGGLGCRVAAGPIGASGEAPEEKATGATMRTALRVHALIEISKVACLTALAVVFDRWWLILFYILISSGIRTKSELGNDDD